MSNERWKPEHGEMYWIVDFCCAKNTRLTQWVNDRIDKNCHSCGNYFKTEAEATAAAEKVEAMLKSLHEPAQIESYPKLTAEVFNSPDCPEWAKYAAVDDNGTGTYYENKPKYEGYLGCWLRTDKRACIIKGEWDASDWQNSLIERPTELPGWCKAGAWVYSTVYKEYVKIKDTDEFDVEFDRGAYCTVSHKSFMEDYKPARIRPYNADEMRGLVGKVVENGVRAMLVLSYRKDLNKILTDDRSLYAEQLLTDCTIDDKPCGKLEHLENGEWVK